MNVFTMIIRIIVLALFQVKIVPGHPLETISAVTEEAVPEKVTKVITLPTEDGYYTTQTIDYTDTTEMNDIPETTESSQEIIEPFPKILFSSVMDKGFKPSNVASAVITIPYNCNPNQLFDGYRKCRIAF